MFVCLFFFFCCQVFGLVLIRRIFFSRAVVVVARVRYSANAAHRGAGENRKKKTTRNLRQGLQVTWWGWLGVVQVKVHWHFGHSDLLPQHPSRQTQEKMNKSKTGGLQKWLLLRLFPLCTKSTAKTGPQTNDSFLFIHWCWFIDVKTGSVHDGQNSLKRFRFTTCLPFAFSLENWNTHKWTIGTFRIQKMVQPESREIKTNTQTCNGQTQDLIPSSDTQLNTWNITRAWSPCLHGLASPSKASCFHVTADAARGERENKVARGVARRCKSVTGRTCYTRVGALARKREFASGRRLVSR